ncbi:MAG: hypothetical protein LBF37_03695 [Rickettsiales bacterium]|jgi:hypothetical protein|nr:hypothetical protein [Rickettsiales bacterium]
MPYKKLLEKEFPNKSIILAGEGANSIAFEIDGNMIRFSKKNDIGKYKTEVEIIDFLRDKINVELPSITIVENSVIPYSLHKKLVGKEWKYSQVGNLNTVPLNRFAKTCATFFAQLHDINIDNGPIGH